MNPKVSPVQAHPHRCPLAKEAKASDAIRDLEKQGILKKVTEPTAWISHNVYREKRDGSVNKAIEVLKCAIPTIDELLPKLNKLFFFFFPVWTCTRGSQTFS